MTVVNGSSGTIFYDAQCSLCQAGRRVAGGIFTRRGFAWTPLQTPAAARRLRISEEALLEAMRVLLPDGRVVSGLDAWIVLFRAVGWLGPVAWLLSRPGIHPVGQACYRWIARHRSCFGGKCRHARPKRRRRTIPFLDLP